MPAPNVTRYSDVLQIDRRVVAKTLALLRFSSSPANTWGEGRGPWGFHLHTGRREIYYRILRQ